MASFSDYNRFGTYFAGGQKMKRMSDSISQGLLLIVVGVIFFLINYGKMSWHFWLNVIELWPLILIFAGIGLLLTRRIAFSAILLAFLLSVVLYSFVMGDKSVFSPTHLHLNNRGAVTQLN